MKCKARYPFYHSELGLVKRGQIIDIPSWLQLGDALEVINDEPNIKQPTAKGKAKSTSRNKRI